jgi:hypothetical protein
MEKSQIKYFLAANSCEGFVSHFADCYSPEDGWKAYIIKGGPGTGKSSFMKYAAALGEKSGLFYELFPCSSDPNSLDAVIFPHIKTVIMDGTAPHIVDPACAGVCDNVLNFGEFWDCDILCDSRQQIIEKTKQNKELHRSAARYIRSAGNIFEDDLKIAAACTNKLKLRNFSLKLAVKHIPQKGGKAKEWVRFLSGVTPEGVVFYGNSIAKNYEQCIIVKDEYGVVSDAVMRGVRDRALKEGYEIITVKSGFLPSELIDHIIIPELSLCFLREFDYGHIDSDVRRIHARRFVNQKQLHKSRERLKFNKKAEKQLLLSASIALGEAKAVHDDLESFYIKAMDFDALNSFAENFCEKLFRK